MKRFHFALILILVFSGSLWANISFTTAIGGDFFNYEQAFLDMGASMIIPVEEGMEVNLGIDFGIATEQNESIIDAMFYVPFDLGLNFVFNEQSKLQYLVGVGLSPQLFFSDEFHFYMGPYAKGGLRVRVHDYMKWFVEVQQDLIIGAPKWINTATKVKTGIIFSFAEPELVADQKEISEE